MTQEQKALDAAKALCLEDESDEEHADHADALAVAYAAFAGRTESNPAPPGETPLSAAVVVTSEDPE